MRDKIVDWIRTNPELVLIVAMYTLALIAVAMLSIPVNYFFGR